jgi:hypothetical protein
MHCHICFISGHSSHAAKSLDSWLQKKIKQGILAIHAIKKGKRRPLLKEVGLS